MEINLTQGLHRAVQQKANAVATICGSRRRTFAELGERVARLAGALQRLGMKPGDRVGNVTLNSDRYLEYYLAVMWGGGAVNPCNIRWSPQEILFSLDDCETGILLVDDAFLRMLPALRASKHLRHVVHVGDGPAPEGTLSYEALIADAAPVEDTLRRGDDLAGVFYTGGTTGTAKGVMLSHANIHASSIALLAGAASEPDPVYLHAAPMFHVADLAGGFVTIIRGGTHVFVPMFTPKGVLEAIQGAGVTRMVLVPTMIQMLADAPELSSYRTDSLGTIMYGASPISEAVLRRAMKAFPHTGFVQGYGMTELAPLIAVLAAHEHVLEGPRAGRLRSGGRAGLCVDVRIVDADDREVPRGTVGEVVARGPNVMLGYWNRPELTAEALRGGWMHTGDGGYMDADGFIYLVDRIKDMIISGGENVYSVEVENAVAQHPAVAACAVIGVPDEKWGERVHAVIVQKPGHETNEAEIIAHCHGLIGSYKCPRSVELRAALPLSGAGKVLKTTLREPYWQGTSRKVN